jgi:hypothetical protein
MVLSLLKTQSWDVIKIPLFDVEQAKLTIDMVSVGHSYGPIDTTDSTRILLV